MRREARRPTPYLQTISRISRACFICCVLFVALLLLVPTVVFAQQDETKDIWDKISAVSGLVSGIAVASIGALATLIYNGRQRRAEESRNSREIAVQRVQTVQTFLPHLASKNELEKKAALLAIGHLDDTKLASDLAKLFGGEGAVNALAAIARSPNQQNANLARRSLAELFALLQLSVVRVLVAQHGPTRFGGTGFVVRSDGLVVTASHVMDSVKPNQEVSVQFANDPSPRKARTVENLPGLRLALLKVEGDFFHALPIEQELPTVGEEIFALHYPRLEEAWTPVVGRVLGTRPEEIMQPNLQETLLIEADLGGDSRPGFAGSPTVNSRGHVVAMGYATVESIALLIPATDVSSAIASISSESDTHT